MLTPPLDPASLKIFRQSILSYMDIMTTRPLMFAVCREAYVAQLSLLLDFLGLDGNSLYRVFGSSGAGVNEEELIKRLDDDFVSAVKDALADIIKEVSSFGGQSGKQ